MFLHLFVIPFIRGGSASRGSAYRGGGLHTGVGVGQTPPPLDTMGYGQRAGGTHPTGMHFCVYYIYYSFVWPQPFYEHKMFYKWPQKKVLMYYHARADPHFAPTS